MCRDVKGVFAKSDSGPGLEVNDFRLKQLNGLYRSRTDTPFRAMDFESIASASSAKRPRLHVRIGHGQRGFNVLPASLAGAANR